MSHPEPFVDIHCHLLPELDDGARDWDEAVEMARVAAADGTTTIVATPHQLGRNAKNDGDTIRAAAARLQLLLRKRNISVQVLPGGDVRIEPGLVPKILAGEVLSLADRRRHVLLELPHETYIPLDGVLRELASAGLVGVLSHPERNHGILGQPGILLALVEKGCLLQVTAGSLLGTFGTRQRDLAEWLVAEGMVHLVATDAHGVQRRPPLLRAAFDRVVELVGYDAAATLFCRNPARIAGGTRIAAMERKQATSAWKGRFFGRKPPHTFTASFQ
jgi:protein-tyrosine phosphatase